MTEQWHIEFYFDADGTAPVKEFLKDPSLTPGELKQLQLRLKLLQSHGLRLLKERSDILDKIATQTNLYELRLDNTPNNPRIFLCTLVGKRFVLLHAFKKKTQKTPKREIDQAVRQRERLMKQQEGEK